MKSIMIADRLRESQAYDQQRISELGIEPADVPVRLSETRRGPGSGQLETSTSCQ
jgi:hypothetical protein